MKIYCLIDNEAAEGFACEHGLSLWIEARGKCLLFDAGESGAFAENAQRLGIDLGRADAAVLSHGHYDHSGGMERFFELNSRAKLYLRRGAAEHLPGGLRTPEAQNQSNRQSKDLSSFCFLLLLF